ncbi:MAG TPA: EDSAP-1 family PEP-CTERM protein [Telluria sp.]|nr:EDSAP-1 family PEP-CTERM protein [Telluria sp.]
MNLFQKTMLSSAVLAAVALGTPGAVRADTFAQSILVIDNFRLLHANGTSYTAGDFSVFAGGNGAYAGAYLNNVGDSAWQAGAGNLDIAQRGVGAKLPVLAENVFTPLAGAAGNFAHADQYMAGSMVTTNNGAAGALLQTGAGASLSNAGAVTSFAGLASATTFSFSLGADDTMTIAFDALPFSQAFASAGAAGGYGNANLMWSLKLNDLTSGASVFAFQPAQLNALSNVSRNGAFGGATTYQPGWLSFGASTALLNAGDVYQVSIAQASFASALQNQQVAEPATLAAFGAGLLAMAMLGRRRRHRGG